MPSHSHPVAARLLAFFLFSCPTCSIGLGADAAESDRGVLARRILADSEVRGGLVVHLGCGDGKLTAALHLDERYVVHGLDAEEANVESARSYIDSLGLYDPPSCDAKRGASRVLPFGPSRERHLDEGDPPTVT